MDGMQQAALPLEQWIMAARPGDRAVYFTGDLSRERANAADTYRNGSSITPDLLAALQNAHKAWQMHEQGLVALVQKRVGFGAFNYLAVALPQAPKPVEPWE